MLVSALHYVVLTLGGTAGIVIHCVVASFQGGTSVALCAGTEVSLQLKLHCPSTALTNDRKMADLEVSTTRTEAVIAE